MKSGNASKNIDSYIAAFPKEVAERLELLRKTIHSVIPNAAESISYGMPTFSINGKHVVYFAGFKKHVGFFPFPSGVSAFKKELTKYKTSTGTIQFQHSEKIPVALVKRITKYRLKERLVEKKSLKK